MADKRNKRSLARVFGLLKKATQKGEYGGTAWLFS
jgi:hypothetical protein